MIVRLSCLPADFYNGGTGWLVFSWGASMRVSKPWRPLAESARLPGQLGVFELAGADGEVVYVGYAGGRSTFGLRSAVADAAAGISGAERFRVEVTSAYLTRYRELLMLHVARHGRLPLANAPEPALGRLSPG